MGQVFVLKEGDFHHVGGRMRSRRVPSLPPSTNGRPFRRRRLLSHPQPTLLSHTIFHSYVLCPRSSILVTPFVVFPLFFSLPFCVLPPIMSLFTLRTLLQNNQANIFKRIFSPHLSALQQVPFSNRTTAKRETDVNSSSDSDSDSDSDWDPHVEMGKSEFWRRKMRTFHGILDINKDGVISFEDFNILVDRFIYLGHLNPAQQQEFKNVVRSMWEERWGTIDPYNLVTTEQYLEDMYHVVNDKQLRKKCHNFLPYLFKAVDKDKSGFITVEEFKLFFNCLGLPRDVAMTSFTAIDDNLDGKLTLKEFVSTGKDFFLTEDQRRPSKMFWGPLMK